MRAMIVVVGQTWSVVTEWAAPSAESTICLLPLTRADLAEEAERLAAAGNELEVRAGA